MQTVTTYELENRLKKMIFGQGTLDTPGNDINFIMRIYKREYASHGGGCSMRYNDDIKSFRDNLAYLDQALGEALLLHQKWKIRNGEWGNRERRTANGERRTANGERRTANGERRTANGERRTANGERRTANGERRTANGERQTRNGERGTGNGERGIFKMGNL